MTDLVKKYFEDHKYAAAPSIYQERVLCVLDKLFKALVFESILEIGPGQGFVLDLIPRDRKIAVTDFTLNTLLSLSYPAIQARLGQLPLKEEAFDIVIAIDVVEHIPDESIKAAIDDAFRIAKFYVILGVPLAEDVIAKTTHCPECSMIFHINHHYRRYLPKDIMAYCPEGWSISSVIYTGTCRPPTHPDTSVLRRLEGEFKAYDRTNCPRCNYQGPFGQKVIDITPIDIKEYSKLVHDPNSLENIAILSSEILVLFAKKGLSNPELPAVDGKILKNTSTMLPLTSIRPDFEEIYCDKYLRKLRTKPHCQIPSANRIKENQQLFFNVFEDVPLKAIFCFPANSYAFSNKTPNALSINGYCNAPLNLQVRDETDQGRSIKDLHLPEGDFELELLSALKYDPVRGYRISLTFKGNARLSIQEVSLLPQSRFSLRFAYFDGDSLIRLNSENPSLYYLSPQKGEGWHLLPENLWDDPFMAGETDSWKIHLNTLRGFV